MNLGCWLVPERPRTAAPSDAEVFRFELAHPLAVLSHPPFDALSDPPFGGWCERRDARTFRLKRVLTQGVKQNVEAFVSPPQATGCRIHVGVCVVHFVLCSLFALGRADLTNDCCITHGLRPIKKEIRHRRRPRKSPMLFASLVRSRNISGAVGSWSSVDRSAFAPNGFSRMAVFEPDHGVGREPLTTWTTCKIAHGTLELLERLG
jgi:hypothetical protein